MSTTYLIKICKQEDKFDVNGNKERYPSSDEIYAQTVEVLDLAGVIAVVNNLVLPLSVRTI